MLSRFLTTKEQKEVVAGLRSGDVDVVSGTHRLLSEDVAFARLGLVIVDEEQRFGVAHKERLKTLSVGVDVLSMTATPIPRTLQMSLAGVRDLSVIETPPSGRMAIQTYLVPFKKAVLAGDTFNTGHVTSENFNGLALIDSPNALTGRSVPKDEILKLADNPDAFVIWDNVYGEYAGDELPGPPAKNTVNP